jgi:hypothetical protein
MKKVIPILLVIFAIMIWLLIASTIEILVFNLDMNKNTWIVPFNGISGILIGYFLSQYLKSKSEA